MTKMTWDDHEWLAKRQAEYDKRMAGNYPRVIDPEAMAVHRRVAAEIDELPYEQGGRR